MNLVSMLLKLAFRWKLILAGALTGLAFPPFPMGFLAWIGPVPLLLVILDRPDPKSGALRAWQWSLGYLVVVLYWVAFNSGTDRLSALVSMFGTVAILSVNFLIIGALAGWIIQRWGRDMLWAFPFIWVAVEYVRTFGSLGFPWIAIGNTQAAYLIPIQLAEITGLYGISFSVILISTALVNLLKDDGSYKSVIILAAVVLAPWLIGWIMLPDEESGSYDVAIVQPNVNANEKWEPELRHQIISQLDSLTVEAARGNPDIIFWPEAAVPTYLRRGGHRYLEDIKVTLAHTRSTLVTGMPDYRRFVDGTVESYNAVGLIDSTGIRTQYNKVILVPFAEQIPWFFRWFKIVEALGVSLGEFTAGTEYTVFDTARIPFSVGVCFETTVPQINRQFARAGARYIAAVVNDGWYSNPLCTGPYQHERQFRLRAIELRRPVVRAANTGISVVYDSRGVETARLGMNEEGILRASIAPSDTITFYSRFGDIGAWLCLLVTLFLTVQPLAKVFGKR